VNQSEDEASGEQAAQRRHGLAPALGCLQRRPRAGQQRLASWRQRDPAPVADEQALAEFGFPSGRAASPSVSPIVASTAVGS
jgi:hypothetical protein